MDDIRQDLVCEPTPIKKYTFTEGAVQSIRKSLNLSLELVRDSLAQHDSEFYRHRLKDRHWAEKLRLDIQQIEQTILLLPSDLQ